MKTRMTLAAIIVLVLLAVMAHCQTSPEFRSMEITAWNSGFESPTATTTMVNYIRSCNMNAVIPEIRLRCDAYYNSSYEPPGTGVKPDPGYDSLGDIIAKAHAQGMEVHPWAVVFRIWTTDNGPDEEALPNHMWFTHGPGNDDPAQDWCMRSDTGLWSYDGVSNLDPGHPAVEDYLISVFMEIVNNYDVDGLNLDYIRYPATNWGYNPVSVARFNAEYGRTGNPSSSDTTWQQWRRDQISNLVKRLYLEIKAVKPWVKLNADVWKSWSTGNTSYFQDWDEWMERHWIDFVHPMSYESSNDTFHSRIDDYVTREYGRHIYPLVNCALSPTGNVVPQIDLVRQHGFKGVGLYAYNNIPNKPALQSALVNGPFPTFVSPSGMPWLDTPTTGYIKGFVKNSSGAAIYPATITVVTSGASTKDTGTGFYGFVDVNPGTITVRAQATGYNTAERTVSVTAGQVTQVDFTLVSETTPPVISNVRTANIQASNAQILWDTNEASTSQVDYGLTSSYGTSTVEDMIPTTSHLVQLVNLQPSTTYHYRVRSYDAVRNVAVSTDRTFTTTASDQPADIIIDNTDPGCTTVGAWLTSSSAADKYGANYFYCSPAVGGKVATWRPSIVVAGNYDVYAWWPAGTNRTTRAPYTVYWNGGSQTFLTNQQINGGSWQLIKASAPLLVGTAGYVTVSNAGIESGWNVMADAVKFTYVYNDTTPPSAPTNLSASATALGQMSLTWTGSVDNVGVTGYIVYRNGVQVGTPATTSYTDSGLTANTQYSYYVKARDAAGNVSAASPTVAKYSLSAAPGSGSVTCDKPVNTWQAEPVFTFTAAGGFGAGKVQYYKYAWTQSGTYTFTGLEGQWGGGNLTPQASASGSWYLHVQGCNGDGVANGTYTYGPYKYDGSAPAVSNLNDSMYVSVGGALHASWAGADAESGIAEYQYAIGTSPEGIGSVVPWTTTGPNTSVTKSGLTLTPNQKYYFGVKALNAAGIWSEPVVSDGVTAAVALASIAAAKTHPDGDAVILSDKVVSAVFGTYFYVCEDKTTNRVSAVRVEGSAAQGGLADIAGILGTVNGERVFTATEITPAAGPGAPDPIFITNRSVGGADLNAYTLGITGGTGANNIGVLVTIAGKVTGTGSGYFTVNDGSGDLKVSTSMLTSVPGVDKIVRVTGIVSTEQSGSTITPILLPRGNTDVPLPWY